MRRLLLLITLSLLLVGSASWARNMPHVNFVVETRNGEAAAQECQRVWFQEGPNMVRELLPAHIYLDTITCLLMESASFQGRFGTTIPDWGVGLAFPNGKVVAIDYHRLPAVGRGLREVFLHEMVHALLFQGAGDTWLPTWFHEGCAMAYSGEWRFADTVSLVLDGHVPSLDRLQGRFPASPLTADRAYRTSLLAVNRLRDKYGPNVPGQIIEATHETKNFSLAFSQVTGQSLDRFISDFAGSMKLRLGWLVMLTRWPTLFVLMSLIFLWGAGRKFIQTRRRLAEMEEEEAAGI